MKAELGKITESIQAIQDYIQRTPPLSNYKYFLTKNIDKRMPVGVIQNIAAFADDAGVLIEFQNDDYDSESDEENDDYESDSE